MKRAMSVIWLLWIGTAAAATPFVLSDGTSRVAPVILHCKSSGNITVPCGNAANPLVVSSGSGGATRRTSKPRSWQSNHPLRLWVRLRMRLTPAALDRSLHF